MSSESLQEAARRECLSALVDGELDSAACLDACAAWRADAAARGDWHAWQLIGDVLRSDDLASDAGHDARFLTDFRARIAAEPVVLAPAPLQTAANAGRWRWTTASAVAAGFVFVLGTFVVLKPAEAPTPASSSLARADGPALAEGPAPAAIAVSSRQSAEPRLVPALASEPNVVVVVDRKVIRDARLDRYLAAHKQFAGTSALGVPSTFLRSATVDPAQR